jgi:transcriptional regulator with GAF, ATPase, and Fis domain
MNSTATWSREELETTQPDQKVEPSSPTSGVTTLKDLVFRLLCEVQSIAETNTLTFGGGLDFYDEVSRFEIDLITRALLRTGGHQVRAAKLLNLKVTTLNSKIKHYKINPNGFVNIYPLIDTQTLEDHNMLNEHA